jgi:uncharacterized membrane protein
MAKAGKRGQKILKILHLIFVCLWVGGAVTFNVLLLGLGPAESGKELLGYNLAAKLVDDNVIVIGAMGSLITGILISLCTNWGFFKHRWIAAKYVLTVFCIVVGIVILGPTVNDQPSITELLGLAALEDPVYAQNRLASIVGGMGLVVCILFMLVISVLKPWSGKKVVKGGVPQGGVTIGGVSQGGVTKVSDKA